VFTTLDPHLQRLAQDALSEGLTAVDALLPSASEPGGPRPRSSRWTPAPARCSRWSAAGRTTNRSSIAPSPRGVSPDRCSSPSCIWLPSRWLLPRTVPTLTPATLVVDEPTVFLAGGGSAPPDTLAAGAVPPTTPGGSESDAGWTPSNYEHEYDGAITLRRALASRATSAPSRSRSRWASTRSPRCGIAWVSGTDAHGYPSITLGVFEASPLEIATAYTIFPNGGVLRPAAGAVAGGRRRHGHGGPRSAHQDHRARRHHVLVTNMMRSVINEGTGAAARANGFALDAAGKSGPPTTCATAGSSASRRNCSPVVWVGFDDNQPLGLSGTQAALPMWTTFMSRALAGHPDQPFAVPTGIVYAEIDRDTGQLAGPLCPRLFREPSSAAPSRRPSCDVHR
jgi:penicillin-binding protein 1B